MGKAHIVELKDGGRIITGIIPNHGGTGLSDELTFEIHQGSHEKGTYKVSFVIATHEEMAAFLIGAQGLLDDIERAKTVKEDAQAFRARK